MVAIKVRFFAAAKAHTGTPSTTWTLTGTGRTIDEALIAADLYNVPVFLRSSFLLNGLATDRTAVLTDGDSLDVLPPFAGG